MSVSVAMATFNGMPYLPMQIESIFEQSVSVDELIISDDGSTDGTWDYLTSLSSRCDSLGIDLRLVSPALSPRGAAQNFEAAITQTSCSIVLLSDQDDLWHSDRVSRALEVFARAEGAELVAFDARLIGSTGLVRGETLFAAMGVATTELDSLNGPDSLRALLKRNFIPGMTMALRQELIRKSLPIPSQIMHDYWFLLVAALEGGVHVDVRCVADYRQHPGNLLGAGSQHIVRRLARLGKAENPGPSILNTVNALCRYVVHNQSLETKIRDDLHDAIESKLRFETARCGLPDAAIRRARVVLALVRSGMYREWASNGVLNAFRDLVRVPTG